MVWQLRRRAAVVILSVSALVFGCQPERINRTNFDRIEIGMTRKEVETLLGPPTGSYQGVLSWTTNHSHTVISVVVDGEGRVTEKSADNL